MNPSLLLFIEQVVEQEITELAVAPEQAVSDNLALFIYKNSKEIEFILYKPDFFRDACELKASGMSDKEIIRDIRPIVGAVSLYETRKCGTWQITSTAADKGYGPLMYDIAFSYVGEDGIMSDRQSVSPSARNVWRYNATKRKDDFDMEPLSRGCLFAGTEPEEILNYKLKLRNPINIEALEANHNQTMNRLRDTYQTNEEIDLETFLTELALGFFSFKYRGTV